MHVFMTAVLLVAPLSASAAQSPAQSPDLRVTVQDEKAKCDNPYLSPARNRTGGGVSKLGDLPAAEAFLTVHREIDGCLEPVLVRDYRAQQPETREETPTVDSNPKRPF